MTFIKLCLIISRLRLADNKGQGLVEYALLLVLITMVVFAMIVGFGQHLGNTFEVINSSVPNAGN